MYFCATSFYRQNGPYIPATKPYELSELVNDLVLLARYLLKPGGRLVFFLPTVTEEYQEVDIDDMICDGMEVIANSLQDFGTWGRRVSFKLHSGYHRKDSSLMYDNTTTVNHNKKGDL